VLLGPSGSGKTTLLNLVGCLDRPDKGKVVVAGTDVNSLTDDELADFRSENIGFVFQSFNLIPVLTAFENVEYPLILAGMDPDRRQRRVKRLLEAVGLDQRAHNRPGQLSGGQRQRVAIARALARKPKLVIADEPTANLDSQTGAAIIALMRWMQQNFKISFIFSSHDSGLIKAADDLIVLRDGVIQSVRRKPEPGQPAVESDLGRAGFRASMGRRRRRHRLRLPARRDKALRTMMTLSLATRNLLRNRRRSVATLLALAIGAAAVLLFGGYSATSATPC
jgi:putative ABC transport system ATP-binding protein